MAETHTKEDRLQVRVDAHSRSLLQRAADYSHKSLSQFVLSTALEKAEQVVNDNELITLSNRDWSVFYDALNKPPAPNAKLKQAFKRYKKARS